MSFGAKKTLLLFFFSKTAFASPNFVAFTYSYGLGECCRPPLRSGELFEDDYGEALYRMPLVELDCSIARLEPIGSTLLRARDLGGFDLIFCNRFCSSLRFVLVWAVLFGIRALNPLWDSSLPLSKEFERIRLFAVSALVESRSASAMSFFCKPPIAVSSAVTPLCLPLRLRGGSFCSMTGDADSYDECSAAKAARLRSREGMGRAVCVLNDLSRVGLLFLVLTPFEVLSV